MKITEKITTLEQALIHSGLDFPIGESEIVNKETGIVSENSKSIYRKDTKQELGIVGKKYRILQNLEAFDFFNIICQDKELIFTESFMIDNGRICILKADETKKITINNYDFIKRYVLINGHDGKVGCSVRFELYNEKYDTSITRGNILKNEVKIKHTANVKQKLEEAKRVEKVEKEFFDYYLVQVSSITDLEHSIMTTGSFDIDEYIFDALGYKGSTRTDKKISLIKDLYEEKGGETNLDFAIAVCQWIDNYSCKNEEKRIYYSNIEKGLKIKERVC
jgi:hypothetical protein